MLVYIDTSVLVAAHVLEPHTTAAQAQLLAANRHQIVLSHWALLEAESALAIKQRRSELNDVLRHQILLALDAFAAHYAPLFLTSAEDYQTARQLCRTPASGLRAGDSLHLALAKRISASHFLTLDQTLAENAAQLGFALQI